MDTWFASLRAPQLLLGAWVVLACLYAVSGSSGFAQVGALIGYIVAFVAYPSALVLASAALRGSTAQRGVVVTSVIVFVALFFVRTFDETPRDLMYSAAGMLALLLIQFAAVGVLGSTERRLGLPGSSVTAWFSLFLLVFGGLVFVHRRYQRAVHVAQAG